MTSCAHCGAPLDGRRPQARYCSPSCRSRDRHARAQSASEALAPPRQGLGPPSPEKPCESVHGGPEHLRGCPAQRVESFTLSITLVVVTRCIDCGAQMVEP